MLNIYEERLCTGLRRIVRTLNYVLNDVLTS